MNCLFFHVILMIVVISPDKERHNAALAGVSAVVNQLLRFNTRPSGDTLIHIKGVFQDPHDENTGSIDSNRLNALLNDFDTIINVGINQWNEQIKLAKSGSKKLGRYRKAIPVSRRKKVYES